MGLFSKKKLDPALEAQQRAEESIRAREAMFSFDPRGPAIAVQEAQDAVRRGDHELAFARAVKSVDRLHDFYVFERFRNREPSPADLPMVDAVVSTLTGLRQAQPDALVKEGVTEATHRLRSISTAIDERGGDSSRYRAGLDELARLAPDIDVSGVFWH